jgi:hypothetical protein
MTSDKRDECENCAHEVHSETTTRKSQQCEATASFRGLAMEAGSQPSEKNLRILDIFDPLEKSSGNLQVFKRVTRGAMDALEGSRGAGVGSRHKERLVGQVRCKCEKYVAVLAMLAMLRKNQGMLDGKVAKGMWQCWVKRTLNSINIQINFAHELKSSKCKMKTGNWLRGQPDREAKNKPRRTPRDAEKVNCPLGATCNKCC